MILSKFQEDFTKRYQGSETQTRYFSAPLCLTAAGSLGAEHGGTALLLPISMKVTCAMRRRADNTVNLEESDSTIRLSDARAEFDPSNDMYTAALAQKIYQKYNLKIGTDMLFHHDAHSMSKPFPDNSATGICMTSAISALFNNKDDDIQKIRVCESVEPEPSHLGAAHKLCALRAEKNAMLAVDCGDLSYKNYSWSLEPYKLVILHEKNAVTYNKKIKHEIDAGMRILKEHNPELRGCIGLTSEQVRSCGRRMTSRQAKLIDDVIEEQQRIVRCKEALANNDIQLFCDLINSRGTISGEKRDFLYQISDISDIIASFITDDGDIVIFVREAYVDNVTREIYDYMRRDCAFLVADSGEGVHEYIHPEPEAV